MNELTNYDVAKKLLAGLRRKPDHSRIEDDGKYKTYRFANGAAVVEFYICKQFITSNLSFIDGCGDCHSMVFDWFYNDEEYTGDTVEIRALETFIDAIKMNDWKELFPTNVYRDNTDLNEHLFKFYGWKQFTDAIFDGLYK